jgi:hypothetical protein
MLARGDEGQWGHIRVFTYRALIEMLELHRFRVIGVTGCPVTVNTSLSGGLSAFTGIVDRIMSKLPRLANRIIVKVSKR